MKNIFIPVLSICLIIIGSCRQTSSSAKKTELVENQTELVENQKGLNEIQREPLKTIEEATEYISSKFKNTEETLWVANSLNDNTGMNMALIMDKLLKKGYMPDGFEQKEEYRIYKYKKTK